MEMISKLLVGILLLYVGQSFVFLEVATFLATKSSTFQWSNGLLKSYNLSHPWCIFILALFYMLH